MSKIKELTELIEELDRKAEAGLCAANFTGAREFLKDIRRAIFEHDMNGGIVRFDETYKVSKR